MLCVVLAGIESELFKVRVSKSNAEYEFKLFNFE